MFSTTAIEIYTPLFAPFLWDHDFWRSSNSLQNRARRAGSTQSIVMPETTGGMSHTLTR